MFIFSSFIRDLIQEAEMPIFYTKTSVRLNKYLNEVVRHLNLVLWLISHKRLCDVLQRCIVKSHRAVQWHYIDKLSNDTVPNHVFIYNQSPSSIFQPLFSVRSWKLISFTLPFLLSMYSPRPIILSLVTIEYICLGYLGTDISGIDQASYFHLAHI